MTELWSEVKAPLKSNYLQKEGEDKSLRSVAEVLKDLRLTFLKVFPSDDSPEPLFLDTGADFTSPGESGGAAMGPPCE